APGGVLRAPVVSAGEDLCAATQSSVMTNVNCYPEESHEFNETDLSNSGLLVAVLAAGRRPGTPAGHDLAGDELTGSNDHRPAATTSLHRPNLGARDSA